MSPNTLEQNPTRQAFDEADKEIKKLHEKGLLGKDAVNGQELHDQLSEIARRSAIDA